MHLSKALVGLGFALLAPGATACSSGDDSANQCTTPVVEGSPWMPSGTGKVHGSGTLPAGLPDGYDLQLLVNTGNSSTGILPPNLFDQPTTCGKNFKFTLTELDAGTYKLDYELRKPNSTADKPDYMGTSTNEFTVADGQDVEFIATF